MWFQIQGLSSISNLHLLDFYVIFLSYLLRSSKSKIQSPNSIIQVPPWLFNKSFLICRFEPIFFISSPPQDEASPSTFLQSLLNVNVVVDNRGKKVVSNSIEQVQKKGESTIRWYHKEHHTLFFQDPSNFGNIQKTHKEGFLSKLFC